MGALLLNKASMVSFWRSFDASTNRTPLHLSCVARIVSKRVAISIRLMHEKSGALFCIDPGGMAVKEGFAMSLVQRNDFDTLRGEAAYPLIRVVPISGGVSIYIEDNSRWP